MSWDSFWIHDMNKIGLFCARFGVLGVFVVRKRAKRKKKLWVVKFLK